MNYTKNLMILLLLVVITFCFVGCSNTTKITGTVKYSDGTPIDFGSVVFDNGKNSYIGTIKKDGTYVTGGVKEVEGIPDGVYKIWLSGTGLIINEVYSKKENGEGNLISYEEVQRVTEKYRFYEKTDLTFEVKRGGQTTYNIVVEKP
jgi:hypothetical protein